MMNAQTGNIRRLHVLRLDPGDDVLLSLRKYVKEQNIEHGVILGGIGSVTSYHFHVVSSTDLPPQEAYPQGEGAYDIAAMTGYILGGRVHCHILFSDDKIAFGGHLEEGCRVLTFNVIPIAETDGLDLTDLDRIQQAE
jgi:uncharacterized protein